MEVKGTALKVMPLFIEKYHKAEGLQQWLAGLSPDVRSFYSMPVMVNLWNDYRKYMVEPTQKLCDLFYTGSSKGAYELGRFSADFSLRGIYKVFVKLGSPRFTIERGATILPTYYRPSKIVIPRNEKGSAIIQITEFPDPHILIEQRIVGWITRALEISGGRNARVMITASHLKQDPITEFTATWEE